jgi:hypothetical protein
MFGKLLKNDLKAQWSSVSSIFLVILIVSVVAEIAIAVSKSAAVTLLGGLLVSVLMLFACFVIIIAVAMMFSKTLFGRAGYLTLTLPVKTNKLIWSKTLSGLIWTYAVYILFFGSVFLWFYQARDFLGVDYTDMANQLFTMLFGKSFSTLAATLIYYLIWFGIIMYAVVQSIYLGITCSHVKGISSLGVVGAILITFLTMGAVVVLTGFVTRNLQIGMVVTTENVVFTSNLAATQLKLDRYLYGFNFAGPVFTLLLATVINAPLVYLVKNKVNIK